MYGKMSTQSQTAHPSIQGWPTLPTLSSLSTLTWPCPNFVCACTFTKIVPKVKMEKTRRRGLEPSKATPDRRDKKGPWSGWRGDNVFGWREYRNKQIKHIWWQQNMVSGKCTLNSTYNTYIYIYLFIYLFIYILVGGFNPSETDKSQFGVLFPTEWNNQIHVPKHQTVFYSEFRAERCVSWCCRKRWTAKKLFHLCVWVTSNIPKKGMVHHVSSE